MFDCIDNIQYMCSWFVTFYPMWTWMKVIKAHCTLFHCVPQQQQMEEALSLLTSWKVHSG